MGAGVVGSGFVSALSFAAMEIDVDVGDVAIGMGDGSFTSITVTKLVGVSDRVGDAIFVSSTFLSWVFRKCEVNSSMH